MLAMLIVFFSDLKVSIFNHRGTEGTEVHGDILNKKTLRASFVYSVTRW